MTQVVHTEEEFQEILDRAMQLYTDNYTRDTFRNLDYWIYVATKEIVANWFMHNE